MHVYPRIRVSVYAMYLLYPLFCTLPGSTDAGVLTGVGAGIDVHPGGGGRAGDDGVVVTMASRTIYKFFQK